jgi:hypothetical protein
MVKDEVGKELKDGDGGGREAPAFRLDICVPDRIFHIEEIGGYSRIG